MPPDAPPVAPPAAAPAAAPPAAAPAPAPSTNADAPRGHEDAFGALDALGREHGQPEPATITPGDGRQRRPDGTFVPKGDKGAAKSTAAKPEASPAGEEDVDKLPTREVVKRYHLLKAKEKEWAKREEEFKKASEIPKEWPEKKTYEERVAERDKAIEEHKKRVSEYEQELQFTNFTRSQAYKDTYEKPYIESWKSGQSRATSMKVVERKNEETGEVLQKGRQGTAEDFNAIMSILDDDAAAEKAEQLWGPVKAAYILGHRAEIQRLQSKSDVAIEEYRTKGAEREKVLRETNEKQYKETAGMIENFRTAAIEKYPQFFKPDDSDPRGNELLASGTHLLERVLKGGVPIKDGEQQMSNEEMAIAVAAVRNKAAAFDRVAYKASSLSKRVKELEKELEQFKSSKPGNGNGNGREAPAGEKTPAQQIYDLGQER